MSYVRFRPWTARLSVAVGWRAAHVRSREATGSIKGRLLLQGDPMSSPIVVQGWRGASASTRYRVYERLALGVEAFANASHAVTESHTVSYS